MRCFTGVVCGLVALFASHELSAATITPGQSINNLSAPQGGQLSYTIAVPSGASNLVVQINGGSGDADLYVNGGSTATESRYDCRPYLTGNSEQCVFASPQATTYYVMISAYESFAGLTLTANYSGGSSSGSSSSSSSGGSLSNGETRSGLSGSSSSTTYFQIDVPSGATQLNIATDGGSGDVDLYVRRGSKPTTSTYDCRPYNSGNDENCSFSNPQSGTWHIMLRGYSSYSGVSLTAGYSAGGGSGSSSSGGATWSGWSSYYSNAIGKSGTALHNALNEAAARGHSRMSYSQVWDALKYTDQDPQNSNNVILIYTGRSQAKSYNSSGNNDPDAWNREHSWPKSHGFPSSGDWAYTDIHHLRASDASVNSSRGNKDYDNGGSSISEAPGNYTDSDSFEPRDSVKGDLARMMFYMDVRYNGGDNTGVGNLKLVNYTGTSGNNLGRLCTLLAWHNADPVDQTEINRHARIVSRQGNRNPFVDYPAWVNQIWGSSCD